MTRIIAYLLNKLFQLLYNQLSGLYDLVASVASAGLWRSWVYSVIDELSGPFILEIGHGPGHLYTRISTKFPMVAAVDASYSMSRRAYRNYNADRHKHPDLSTSITQKLPFKQSSFNQVVSTFPAPYIIDPESIKEIYRILSPGGHLLILPAAWITGKSLRHRLASFLFKITHQSPVKTENPFSILTRSYENQGFIVEIKYLTLETSTVAIIKANKPIRCIHQENL